MINILSNRYTIASEWCFETYKNYIRPDQKVVIVPFSFRDERIATSEQWLDYYSKEKGQFYSGIVTELEAYGIDEDAIAWINYFDDSKSEARVKIQNADVLYFPGGLPDRMMERLHKFELVDVIEEHEGVIIGFSGGAMIQLEKYHITPDKDYTEFKYNKGLNMIKSFNIEVHYDNSNEQRTSIKRVIKETGKPVYAIEDNGAVIVDGKDVKLVGKVHYLE